MIRKIIFSLLCLVGMTSMQAQQKWDFTQTPADDVTALAAATTEWAYTEASNRFESKTDINGAIKAGQYVLEMTKGLTVNAAAKKIRIDVDNRLQLAGKNITLTTPTLKKGQQVTIVFASTGTTAVTFDANTNLSDMSGFTAADKNTVQTGTGTVTANGTVSFKSSGGSINIFSLEVSGGSDNPDNPVTETHDVDRNTLVNQAQLTLSNGDMKYYNPGDLYSISFEENNVIMNLINQQKDIYSNVQALDFSKKQGSGDVPGGEIVNGSINITEAKGWYESAYAKWDLLEGADGYHVYVKGDADNDFVKIDDQLVRNYGTYGRADAVGLRAGTYEMKVVATKDGQELATVTPSTASGLEVRNYSRQGYAHFNYSGVGAYNDDGTLKQNAKVFYVTKNTAKTIKTSVVTSTKGAITECTGIQAIIEAYEKGCDTTPIAFRFIGLVTNSDIDYFGSSEEGIQVKGRRADSEMNMTFEGIGDDATIRGFGFLVRNAKSIEFRNFAVMRCMDDGISLDTDNSNIWIHHIDMFYGKHGSGDHDKGDGAIDVKSDSKYVTVSYCRYWDTGKTNMFGMKSESGPNYISYDHNWFDHSDSRHPRVRTMSVHVWNNFFDNVAKYGVGATTGSSVFVENNYFLKTKKPILSSNQGTDALGSGTFSGEDGGMIKAFGNYFDRTASHFSYYTQANPTSTGYDAYETDTRDEQVPVTEKTRQGGTSYDNFDTNPQLIYQYTPDAAGDVPAIVTGYFGAGRLNHGDITYSFPDCTGNEDIDSNYDTTLGGLLDNYQTKLVGIFGEENSEEPVGPDDPVVPVEPQEGTILASFNESPSSSMFAVGGSYGDGKITYNEVYYKKGVKLDSKGSITFTPTKDYNMTIVLATVKSGRDVSLNGVKTTVSGTENTEGSYYELQPIAITAGTEYKLTKGSAESIVMLIKLDPR